jgi:hypothetical protein
LQPASVSLFARGRTKSSLSSVAWQIKASCIVVALFARERWQEPPCLAPPAGAGFQRHHHSRWRRHCHHGLSRSSSYEHGCLRLSRLFQKDARAMFGAAG